jgi:hypothetical protein
MRLGEKWIDVDLIYSGGLELSGYNYLGYSFWHSFVWYSFADIYLRCVIASLACDFI